MSIKETNNNKLTLTKHCGSAIVLVTPSHYNNITL